MKQLNLITLLGVISLFVVVFAGCDAPLPSNAGTPAAAGGKTADPNAQAKGMLNNPGLSADQKANIQKGIDARAGASSTGK